MDEAPWTSPWAEALRSISDPHGTDAPEAGPVFDTERMGGGGGWSSRRRRHSGQSDLRREDRESGEDA